METKKDTISNFNFSNLIFWRRKCRIGFFILIAWTFFVLALIKTIDLVPKLGSATFLQYSHQHKPKFAYVFYVTSSDYDCYALINVHRLIFDLRSDPDIDILMLTTESSHLDRFCPNWTCPFPPGRLKIRTVSSFMANVGGSLADNPYYRECYVKLEAFNLYEEYDRLIILDADGFLLNNIDHLFHLDLSSYNVAAALAHYLSFDWISTVLLVVEPSKQLYDSLTVLLNRENISKVITFANGPHYDMDILNYVLDAGNSTRRLSKYYALLDTYFFDKNNINGRTRENELNQTYYMHFSARKPLLFHGQTRSWPLNVNSASNETNDLELQVSKSLTFDEVVYYPFWKTFDKYCRVLVQGTSGMIAHW